MSGLLIGPVYHSTIRLCLFALALAGGMPSSGLASMLVDSFDAGGFPSRSTASKNELGLFKARAD